MNSLLYSYSGVYLQDRDDTVLSWYQILSEQANRFGNRRLFVERLGDQDRIVTYSEFHAETACAISWLKSLNIRPDIPVGFLPRNSVASVRTLFALLACGNSVVMLNDGDPIERQQSQLELTSTEVVFSESAELSLEGISTIQIPLVVPYKSNVEVGLALTPASCDRASITMFTTGSTAASKAVMLSQLNFIANGKALVDHLQLTQADHLLCVLPIYYANGLGLTIFATILAGASVKLLRSFEPLSYPHEVALSEATVASVVPNILDVVANWRTPLAYPQLRYFISAAAPLRQKTAATIWERYGKRVIQGYGLTETTNFSSMMPIDLSDQQYERIFLQSSPPPVGHPIFGNDIAILDEHGRQLPFGQQGEVCMRGHNIMLGYYRNPEATRDALRDGWFHSGDVGVLQLDRDFARPMLTLVGRQKNMLKVGGRAVSLDEIERLVASVTGVSDVVAVGVPHEVLGEIPACLIVSQQTNLSAADITNHLKKYLPPDRMPRIVRFVNRLPRTPNGKLNRAHIARQHFADHFS